MTKPANKTAYLYLARRDKRGARLIARLYSPKELISRVSDVKALGLSRDLEKNIAEIAHANRMDWELWIATANSYADLRKFLSKRGYSEIPVNPIPALLNTNYAISERKLPSTPKTMIPRAKQ